MRSPRHRVHHGPPLAPPVDLAEAEALLRARLPEQPHGEHVLVGRDDVGGLLVRLRRDLLHLDADALNDRLHHWTLTELARRLPAASAYVAFERARPAAPHEDAELDLQERWLDLEPTLRLEVTAATKGAEVEEMARLVPRFLALVEREGRPAGFRLPEVGAPE